MKKKTKKYLSYWGTIILGFTTGWFVWKTWDKLDSLVGNGNIPYIIAGVIIIVAMVLGHFSFKKLAEKFT